MFSFLLKRNVIVGLDWMRIKRDIIRVYLRVLYWIRLAFWLHSFNHLGKLRTTRKKEGTTNKKGGGAVFLGRIIKSPQLGEQNK